MTGPTQLCTFLVDDLSFGVDVMKCKRSSASSG